jgi:hypothetical protein
MPSLRSRDILTSGTPEWVSVPSLRWLLWLPRWAEFQLQGLGPGAVLVQLSQRSNYALAMWTGILSRAC